MNKHLFSRLGAAVLALCLLLTGCGEPQEPVDSPTPSPTATPTPVAAEFALACYPDAGFHPITGTNRTNLSLGGLIYEGLFALDQTFTPVETLCSAYTTSADGLTWTFTLRPGVTFSDGTPLSAGQVVSSLELARGSTLYGARFGGIASIAAGEGSVTITLSQPNSSLPALLDIPIVLETGGTPLGTGPYVLSGSGEGYALTRNPSWWRGEPLPRSTIPLRTIQEADDLIHAFDTREISLVATDLTATGAMGFSGTFNTVDYPTTTMLYVGFNASSGPCANAGVRKALLYALDRETIATSLYSRHAVAAPLPIHPASSLYPAALADTLNHSPQEVADTLTAAGWTQNNGVWVNGRQTLSVELVVSAENQDRLAAADRIVKDLRDAGVQATLTKLNWTDYLSALERKDFDLYLGEVRLTADFDLTALLTPGGALNYGGYNNPDTVQKLNTFRASTGEGRGWGAKELCQQLADDPPFGVICFKNWSLLTQWSGMTNLTPTQQNLFYQFWAWDLGG